MTICLLDCSQKGISKLTDEFARVEEIPRVQWEQVLGALNSAPQRDNSIFQAVTDGDDYDRELREVIIKGDKSTTTIQPRAPPDVNTILRLVGPWLFDACLTRKPRFAAARSEALRCLGKLLCQVSSGRAKRINWAHGIRSLMALQSALLDDDERINASAVYNWSKIFSLYGNHTLRGAGVMTGPFHKAVERIFRYVDATVWRFYPMFPLMPVLSLVLLSERMGQHLPIRELMAIEGERTHSFLTTNTLSAAFQSCCFAERASKRRSRY